MAYCTLDDLKEKISEEELIQLTDDEETGAIVMSRIDWAITGADALIDGYCAKVYKVPLSPVPALAKQFSVDIAIYKLLQRKEGANEDREKDFNNAVKFLEKVADGKASMGVQPPPDPPDAGEYTGGVKVSTRDKMFGADTMSKY